MLALLIGAAMAAATPAHLLPVDRCKGDTSFDQFRAALGDAAARKDAGALRKLAADDIRADFGGGGGWSEFASAWSLSEPATSKLLQEIEQVMSLGCAATQADGRVFPGLFEDMGDDADPFELVVIRPGGVLRAAPEKTARQVAKLEWATANVIEDPSPENWVKVQVPGGPSGWIENALTVSPLDYRLIAERWKGRWLITAFVAGD